MGNYASLRGPIGLNRVYAEVPAGPLQIEPWLTAIKAGRTFATNGPLLKFSLGGQPIGGEVKLPKKQEVPFKADLSSIVPVDHLQILCNGNVAHELKLDATRTSAHVEGVIPMESTGWCVLRAYSDQAEYPILDLYPYATTSPIYVNLAGAPLRSPNDARYFAAWIERLIAAARSNASWNTDDEKQLVLTLLHSAKQKYETLQ
jgi:hypothetical protein